MGLHRDDILDGMKMALWKSAVDSRAREGGGPRTITTSRVQAEQDAALLAAKDLAKLYEANLSEAIGAPIKLEHYYESQRGTGYRDAYKYGWHLAEVATMDPDRKPSHTGDARVPHFIVMFVKRGTELVWEGGTEDAPGKLFGRHERLPKAVARKRNPRGRRMLPDELELYGAADGYVQGHQQITFEPIEVRAGDYAYLYSGRDDDWHRVTVIGPADCAGYWRFEGDVPGGRHEAHESKFMAQSTRKLHGRPPGVPNRSR